MRQALLKILIIAVLSGNGLLSSQNHNHVSVVPLPEICVKGSASLIGIALYDSLGIEWSTGQTNVVQITGLSEGNYSTRVRLSWMSDSIRRRSDTTIYFEIKKEDCPVSVSKYFSPNGDGYNDLFTIANIEAYPDFEFLVYNKWGQRVHYQQKTYITWDGTWLSTPLPDGTYYFVLFHDKSKTDKFLKGDITILR